MFELLFGVGKGEALACWRTSAHFSFVSPVGHVLEAQSREIYLILTHMRRLIKNASI